MHVKPMLSLIAVICSISMASNGFAAESKPSLTLESIFSSPDFVSQSLDNLQWNEDGSDFTFTRPNPETGQLDIFQYDLGSGEERLALSGDTLVLNGQPVDMSGYRWTSNRHYLLVTGPMVRTWDSIMEGPHYIYDVESRSLATLAEGNAHLRNVYLSPDGQKVGYVLENNLYFTDLASGSTWAVTTDGDSNIWNGIFDYGSTEFGFVDAWHWSPDSQKIAYWRLDVTDVKVYWKIGRAHV